MRIHVRTYTAIRYVARADNVTVNISPQNLLEPA